ncbi:MAG: FG-GAP repeat domain-containing protein [Phycisphaerae bacterium]
MRHAPTVVFGWILAVSGFAQTVYNSTPDWVSADTRRGTGGALVDLDRDGWLDFVVANGNDMARQRVAVYYNRGDGTFPPTPDWLSGDQAYNGHLDVADVNGDGWPDVAVAVLGEFYTIDNAAKLYLNNNGVLSSLPDWQSTQEANAFGCAFGDVNNDGLPDLAVGTGWSYSPQHFFPNYVYLNVGGMLENSASWESDDTWHYMGVLWVDADDDGWLDLVGVASLSETRIYANLGGTLETTASWQTTDSSDQDAIMATAGDVTGDGWRDLFVTDNTQLYGSGRFRQYTGLPSGYFETTYSWSYFDGYGSAVALADVNADGLLDLATGAWWDRTRLFFNNGTGFGNSPSWSSGVTSVIEKIVFADIDNDGLHTAVETFPGDGQRRLFYLDRQPIQEITSVDVDGLDVVFDYTYSREQGWITVELTPEDYLEVRYAYSNRLDMAITNWDNTVGNYVYYNQLGCVGDLDGDGDADLNDLAILLADYGCTSGCSADLDGDDDTDLNDLALLLSDYGCE